MENKVEYNYYGYIKRVKRMDREVFSNSLIGLKRKASIIANGYLNSYDEMDVYFRGKKMFCLYRKNNKMPCGIWTAGEWR